MDKLKGEEIPISAQIVALADVYDALAGKRADWRAYSHETSASMMLNGEVGAFNPLPGKESGRRCKKQVMRFREYIKASICKRAEFGGELPKIWKICTKKLKFYLKSMAKSSMM